VSAQVRPEQQPDWLRQEVPTVEQLLQLPPSHTRPRQQSLVEPQLWVAALHVSQVQPSPPTQIEPSYATQVSVGLWLQQSAVDRQVWSCAWQATGTAHFPATHCSVGALQQSALATQFPPVGAQVLADSQVPDVVFGGTTQVSPAQQSPPVVQVWWRFEHGAAQTPPTQLLEQQSLATVQAWPLLKQDVGTSQLNVPLPAAKVQTVPAQQLLSSAPWHGAWSAVQVGWVQCSTPVSSGTHGAKLQHWSRNWQTLAVPVPVGMQHCGLLAS
jgi:hypothetical protein